MSITKIIINLKINDFKKPIGLFLIYFTIELLDNIRPIINTKESEIKNIIKNISVTCLLISMSFQSSIKINITPKINIIRGILIIFLIYS